MVNSLLLLVLSSAPLLQDPTRPLEQEPEVSLPAAQVATQGPRLQAVLHQGAGASAIIDGRRYRVGDQVGPYRLAAIGRRQVRLEAHGEALELTLFSPLISQGIQ